MKVNIRKSGVQLPPAPKHPCPLCGQKLSDLDLMAHLRWHRRNAA